MRNKVLEKKIEDSKKILMLAAEISKEYYHEPLIITYSGGKDSDVLLELAKESLDKKQFELLNSHTTIDAPETVYYIRDTFKELEKSGIKTTIHYPHYEDGRFKSIWSLIEENQIPPTRIQRYCCYELKETSVPNRIIALGVREAESINRRGREVFATRADKKGNANYFNYYHALEVFETDKKERKKEGLLANEESVWDCTLVTKAKKNQDLLVNPIYKWTDSEIWEFIHERNMKYNPLYDKGFKRVGCIGCPMSTRQKYELEMYPKYKQNFINAFERMLKRRKEQGKDVDVGHWKDAESTYKWWIQDDTIEGQMTIYDFIGDPDDNNNDDNL